MIRILATIALTLTLAAQAGPDWVPLFNGRDLTGWSVVGDAEAFTISPTEPALIAQSALPISRLQTNQDYADFHLRLEYRVAKRGALSGLDFRLPADSVAERPAPWELGPYDGDW